MSQKTWIVILAAVAAIVAAILAALAKPKPPTEPPTVSLIRTDGKCPIPVADAGNDPLGLRTTADPAFGRTQTRGEMAASCSRCTLCHGDKKEPPKPMPNPKPAIYRIQFGNAGCSATALLPRRSDGRWELLTAAHCINKVGQAGNVTLHDGSKIGVKVASVDPKADLVWLVTDSGTLTLNAACLAADFPAKGSRVWQAGFGRTRPGERKDGTVNAGVQSDGQGMFGLLVDHGDSGGGIFSTDTGELVAAVSSTTAPGKEGTVWGGSCVAAVKLRPKVGTSDWSPATMPTRGVHVPLVKP